MSSWNTPPRFDRSQFDGKRARAVSATTGIAFSDYARMHVQRRERVQERRLPTPRWAVRDEWLRELLVVYLEERFYVTPAPGATLARRLEFARYAAITYAPKKRELLDSWLDKYHRICTVGMVDLTDEQAQEQLAAWEGGQMAITADIARDKLAEKSLHDLEIQIQNLDTDLVLTSKGHAEVIASIVYLYYRLGWDSVTVAEQLGLKSPHIRIVLYRLHAAWKKHLSHRESRIGEGAQDSEENPQGADSSTGSSAPSPLSEPLGAIFDGGNSDGSLT